MTKKTNTLTTPNQIPWTLKEDENLYRSIYHHSPLCLAFSDTKGNILRVNQRYCELLGYSESELLGKNFGDFTPEEIMKREVAGVREAIRSGVDFFRMEKSMIHKSGQTIWADISMTVVRKKESQEVKFIIAMLNDITEKVKIAAALRQSKEELKQQNSLLETKVAERTKELDHYNKKLKASNQELESFAYATSHDLKEPLRTIGGFATLFRKKYLDKIDNQGRDYLNFIISGVDRMNALIASILKYSRISQKTDDFAPANLHTIVSDKVSDLAKKISDVNAKISIGKLPSQLICIGDQLGIVFYNLISNGLKFNKSLQPIVKVYAEEQKDKWLFYVSDNGIGIHPDYQEHIFGLFKRLHNKEEYEGSGVGLALCQKIVERHGGNIELKSSENEGSTFCFSISKQLAESLKQIGASPLK